MRLNMMSEEITALLDFSTDDDATEWFDVPPWALFVGVFIPTLTNDADVGIEVSRDGGTTPVPVVDLADGNDLVICGSTDDPAYVDISDYIRAFVGNRKSATAEAAGVRPTKFRFTVSVAEDTADMPFYVVFRG